MNEKVKNIVLIVILGAVLIIAYNVFFSKDDTVTEPVASGGSEEANELLKVLRELESIKLDGRVFTNAVFRSLEDFSVTIPEEPQGRENPFLPVGYVAEEEEDEEEDAPF